MTYDLLCFFNQKAAYDMRMSDWSSDVFSSDLQYGSEIIDVRIKRADLPDGTPLQSAFQRMRTAREQEALTIRAQGAKQAQIIRAEADADASRIYAESFGKDPDFRSEEHTSELQSLMRISYAVFCLKKKTSTIHTSTHKYK